MNDSEQDALATVLMKFHADTNNANGTREELVCLNSAIDEIDRLLSERTPVDGDAIGKVERAVRYAGEQWGHGEDELPDQAVRFIADQALQAAAQPAGIDADSDWMTWLEQSDSEGLTIARFYSPTKSHAHLKWRVAVSIDKYSNHKTATRETLRDAFTDACAMARKEGGSDA